MQNFPNKIDSSGRQGKEWFRLSIIWHDFITGFQFFTRIPLVRQTEWTMESFGRSVKMLPLIGALIGGLLAGAAYLLQKYAGAPQHLMAAGLIVAEIFITGGLHCDGFMDTADGVFSGRSRERMLEIMKDSRVGAFGAMAFTLLVLVKYSLYLDIEAARLPLACFAMAVAGKMGIVIAVTSFEYARPEGLGKMFSQHHDKHALGVAALLAALLTAPFGLHAVGAVAVAGVAAVSTGIYVSRRLGCLTGDVYGAVHEVAQLAALLLFLG